MNETQLREELVDAYSPVQLPDPVDDIMRRGRAIHRSRRAPLLGLLVAVSAVALVLASPWLVLRPRSRPGVRIPRRSRPETSP